jgi:glycosyltransferase involved in cell wall biosynthesis
LTRILVFSTLYPNAAQPNHGVFVENRLRHTLALGELEAAVLAPVPYFPFSHSIFGRYAAFASVPKRESRHGLELRHPRYTVFPGIDGGLTPWLLYRAALPVARQMQAEGGRFDVIDAHYFYPDGVAAAWLGRTLGIPVVITGRGTDLTLIPQSAGPRARIQSAAAEASAMITVCEDLMHRLTALGADQDRTVVLRNGVDLELFSPGDRAAARAVLDLAHFTLLSVGALIPRKGHDLIIRALADCPDCRLLIAGSGPMRSELERLAASLGVAERVRFLGDVAHKRLPEFYRAADVMVLASSREGWANVLLEAMACGTPVVATNVNGTAEALRSDVAGRLMPERTSESLVETLNLLRRDMPRREDTRKYAEKFGWPIIAKANKALLLAVAKAGRAGRESADPVEKAKAILAAETV